MAYALLGGGCGCLTLLAALTVRLPREADAPRARAVAPSEDSTTPAAPSVTLRAALADPRQWYLNASWLLLGGVALMISVHVVPFARDQGISLAGASLTLTAYGLGSVGGRLAAGAVSDRLGTFVTIRVGYLVQIAALVTLLWVPSRDAVLTSLVVFGIGFAAADTIVTKVIPDVFGVRAIGAIMGILALGWRAGAALGPAAAGFLYDATSSYTVPFAAAPVAVLTSWGLFALATRR
jgi:predicted MFS family arabinose efflux permease